MRARALLAETLDLCVDTSDDARRSAIAFSKSGEYYIGAEVTSATNVLHHTAEQVALLRAAQHRDYQVELVMALGESHEVSPLTQMVIIDFARRSGNPIAYQYYNTGSGLVMNTPNVNEATPYYQPDAKVLDFTRSNEVGPNWLKVSQVDQQLLKDVALRGLLNAFTTRDGATRYGTAVVAGDEIHFSGQYSSFEGRTNIHAEVAAYISALMNGNTGISEVGVVSTKHVHEPCRSCGVCLQFMTEMNDLHNVEPTVTHFAREDDVSDTHTLRQLLPFAWSPRT